MDNDGKDEPDDEEYKDNKDKAIKKAMNKEMSEPQGGKRRWGIANHSVLGLSKKI